MRSVYQREDLIITEFENEDVITTSGVDPTYPDDERENAYGSFNSFGGGWW